MGKGGGGQCEMYIKVRKRRVGSWKLGGSQVKSEGGTPQKSLGGLPGTGSSIISETKILWIGPRTGG